MNRSQLPLRPAALTLCCVLLVFAAATAAGESRLPKLEPRQPAPARLANRQAGTAPGPLRELVSVGPSGIAVTDLDKLEGDDRDLALASAPAKVRPRFTAVTVGQALSAASSEKIAAAPAAPVKRNTGWILDRHVYDKKPPPFPTLTADIRGYDEGGNDIGIDAFGYMWEVYSFWWTDTLSVGDHPNASFCLLLQVSGDGGSSWFIDTIYYDALGRDLINPRMAINTVPNPNRIFIAYEYAYSATDHDVYVWSFNSTFSGSPANSQDATIAASALNERNPDIASDYTAGLSSFRVVAYDAEYRAGSSDYDIFTSQSTGDGADGTWTATPAAAAATANMETRPALFAGASGSGAVTPYMHLAYNYDVHTPTQLLLNPAFDLGNNGNWTASAGVIDNSATPPARSAPYKAWMAGYNSAFDTIYQTVAIPANALSAGYSFYLRITTAEGGTQNDFLRVQARNTSGALLATLATFNNTQSGTYSAYTQVNVNLAAYKGQTIRLYMEGTTNATLITSFLVDDTALNVTLPTTATAHEVRYARSAHTGAPTNYPSGFGAATKLTVLGNDGATRDYGPPSIAATHGGSGTLPEARITVAADEFFPAGVPNAPDPARYQIALAWNMCNGGTTCANLPCGKPRNWQEAYFYDDKADERYPALVVDGMGLGTNGLAAHPLVYMAYYHRAKASVLPAGQASMILTDASDETCAGFGFVDAAYFFFTAETRASDEDDLVVAKPGTLQAFNYWDGYPGVSFSKFAPHPERTDNDDVYFTTIGDNYDFDTRYAGAHIYSNIMLFGEEYLGPITFAWPAGYLWNVTVDSTAEDTGRYYEFSSWSTGAVTPTVSVGSDFCDGFNPCPFLDYFAFYSVGCSIAQSEATGLRGTRSGANVSLTWTPAAVPQDVQFYSIYRATSPTAAANFTEVGTSNSAAYLDTTAPGSLYYYLVTGNCGPYEGPWGHYGQ